MERTSSDYALLKLAIVLLALLVTALAVVDHYGISSDELVEIEMVQWNLDFVSHARPIPSNLKHYGTVFNFTAEFVYTLLDGKQDDFLGRVKVKHIVTVLWSFGAYLAVAGITAVLAGKQFAWIAVLFLATFPRFWGHSFFNPKDIPFAAAFTVGTYAAIRLLGWYFKADYTHIGWNSMTRRSFLCGLIFGFVTGIRIAGFLFLLFVPLVQLVLHRHSMYRQLKAFAWQYLIVFTGWAIVTVAVHPSSWSNPVWWFLNTVSYLSSHDAGIPALFAGRNIPSGALPWYYLPRWFFLTVPLLHLGMLLLGVVWAAKYFRSLAQIQRAALLLVLLQFCFLPAIAIAKRSPVYDEMRQFLVVLPAAAVLCTLGFALVHARLKRAIIRVAFYTLVLIGFAPVLIDMRDLHPYEYVYFNRISGGLQAAHGKYETDYWGLSMREGMEWINRVAPVRATVISSRYLHTAEPFGRHDLKIVPYNARQEIAKPFYYIARPRWNYQKIFPECAIVYEVRRQRVPLTIVKFCD